MPQDDRLVSVNVLGGPLKPCSLDPITGFYRNGCCDTGPLDRGQHTVCAVMTEEFLAMSTEWAIKERLVNNNGLTIIERV